MHGLHGNGRTWLACLILGLVTLALYWPARHYDFVEFDDPSYVFENQTVRNGLSAWGLVWSFVDAHESNWHPLTWLSHMADCQVFGLRPGMHHLVNVLIHCANGVLLFLVLRSMTGAFWRSAFVAAVFAWHPLRVESVAWISERKDVLSGLFFMLTIWAYGRYARSPQPTVHSPQSAVREQKLGVAMSNPEAAVRKADGTRFTLQRSNAPRRFYVLSLLFFALGLMSKPMLVTLPLVLLLLDFWPLGRIQLNAQDLALKNFHPLLREKLPFFCLSIAVSVITIMSQRSGGAMVSLKSESVMARLGGALAGYVTYLEKFFWPQDLSVLYLRRDAIPASSLLLAVLVVGGVTAAAGATWRRCPFLAVGWLWFLIMLIPVSGLVQTGLQSVADRYTYLPAIGLAVMVAWGANELTAALVAPPAGRIILGCAGAAVLCSCALATRNQLAYWQNTETLMERALQFDPNNYVAHNNLGAYFLRLGRAEDAQAQHRLARGPDPSGAKTSEPGTNAMEKPKE